MEEDVTEPRRSVPHTFRFSCAKDKKPSLLNGSLNQALTTASHLCYTYFCRKRQAPASWFGSAI